MVRNPENLGARKHARVVFEKPGFVIPTPDSPWIECEVVDISQSGVCLDVGTLFVPDLFGVAFNPSGPPVTCFASACGSGVTGR